MVSLPGASNFEIVAIWIVLAIAFIGLAYALLLRKQVLKHDKGNEKMQQVWGGIREGAEAYLHRQLKTIIPLIIVFTV
ncbi:MAG: sodium/proton-translocating pyrophosphatase, partial [Bacteroidota bacterium]|nr:sodium/proton-translocating pyrophosphatase [Bacteroidota bacterium]MDP4226524.1 sodium/proton-translocating pyrophosphatase [Bacteroidota bacterium]